MTRQQTKYTELQGAMKFLEAFGIPVERRFLPPRGENKNRTEYLLICLDQETGKPVSRGDAESPFVQVMVTEHDEFKIKFPGGKWKSQAESRFNTSILSEAVDKAVNSLSLKVNARALGGPNVPPAYVVESSLKGGVWYNLPPEDFAPWVIEKFVDFKKKTMEENDHPASRNIYTERVFAFTESQFSFGYEDMGTIFVALWELDPDNFSWETINSFANKPRIRRLAGKDEVFPEDLLFDAGVKASLIESMLVGSPLTAFGFYGLTMGGKLAHISAPLARRDDQP